MSLVSNPIDDICVWNKYCGLKTFCVKIWYAHLQKNKLTNEIILVAQMWLVIT